MNKSEWKKELNNLIKKSNLESWEQNQDRMIKAFKKSELKRMELFNETENVGYIEELIDLAIAFQGYWSYEKNAHLTPIF